MAKNGPVSGLFVNFPNASAHLMMAARCLMMRGFNLPKGRLRYIRMLGSTETACRSNKKGQCFSANMPEIRISRTDRGELSLGDKQFKVRYFGCTQIYYFTDTPTYREIWPDKKRCFWASKRRFYIAPYQGNVTIID